MQKLKVNKYLLRIAGINLLMLFFGMIFGHYLPLWLNATLIGGFAVLWFLIYDENTWGLANSVKKEGGI